MDKQIMQSDAQIIQDNIRLYQENRRMKCELEELKKENEALRAQIRGQIRGHMMYYEKRRQRKDLLSDIGEAGRVMAGLLAICFVAWNVFMIVWGIAA